MVVKAIVFIVGLSDFLAGVALLVAPRWFFDHIGTYPPYSPHFLGDAGAFLTPVGAALILAATNPVKYRSLVVLGTIVSVLHFLNHLYGSMTAGESWLQTLEVAVPAVAMLVVVAVARGTSRVDVMKSPKGVSR